MHDGFSRALKVAQQATARLYKSETPLPNNLWSIQRVEESLGRYFPVNRKCSKSVYDALKTHVDSLSVRSVEYFVEADYFEKLDRATPRNFYYPESLQQQASVSKWFLGGTDLPDEVSKRLIQFWKELIPSDYRVWSPFDISCSKASASSGIALLANEGEKPEWTYSEKGETWEEF